VRRGRRDRGGRENLRGWGRDGREEGEEKAWEGGRREERRWCVRSGENMSEVALCVVRETVEEM
jgi:hypothetical protein